MNVTRYRAGDRRYLAVDAEQYVPDRATFAARHCDDEAGVAPPADEDQGVVTPGEQSVSPSAEGAGVAAPDGGAADDGAGNPERGADGVLFLALESEFTPPRVVMTVVRPDGERTPCCVEGVRCAARWAAARTGAERVMVDTQAGTREARVHDDGSVSVEIEAVDGRRSLDRVEVERGPVVREFETEIARTTP